MFLRKLNLTCVRNYSGLSLEIPREGALFEGLNGAGKTNILESIHLLCTGKSQRGASRTEMIQFGAPHGYVEGVFEDHEGHLRTTSIGFGRDRRVVMRTQDRETKSFSEWFDGRPIVSFGADDLELVYGAPQQRRRFLDLLCSQMDREYLEGLLQYRAFLERRNHLLTSRPFDRIQCEIYEQKLAEHGATLIAKRTEVCNFLATAFSGFYGEIAASVEQVQLRYEPSVRGNYSSKNEWKNVFYTMLADRRNRDVEMGFSTVGPHRDDVGFLLDTKPARTFGSQGQCRSLALALKLSSVVCVQQAHQGSMIFLIDDAISELDPQRASRVYPLVETRGQVFIATPANSSPLRPELLRCTVSSGNVTVA